MIRLGGPDSASIKFLGRWPHGIYICPYVENRDARLHDFLRTSNLENGSSLFHGECIVEIESFRDLTSDGLIRIPDSVIHYIFMHWFKRLRNYSHIENMAQASIVNAKIPPAHHLTPTNCIVHAGRTINVVDAALRIAWMKTLTPEAYGILAYGVDFGFPPFDLLCTCDLEGVIVGVDYDYAPRKPIVPRTKWDRLNHIRDIFLKQRPAEMSDEKFSELLELMLRVSDELSGNGDPQSKLERQIGEAFGARGRDHEAIIHLEKAIRLRPKVGVKKLLEKLKSRSHPFTLGLGS